MTSSQASTSPFKGMGVGFAGFTAFTVADAQAKQLTLEGIPAFQVSFIASLVALSVLCLFPQKFGGFKSAFINPKWKLLWFRGLVLGLQGIAAVAAFSMLPFVKVYTLIFIAPFMAILFGIFLLGDKVGWRRWLCVAFGFSGVLIALRPGIIELELGALIALACGMLAALAWTLMRFIGQGQSFMVYAAYPLICNAIISSYPALSGFVMTDQWSIWVLYVGCGLSAMAGIILLSHAFTLAPADCVSPFHYTQLIFGVLWGYLFFEELPDQWTVLGGFIILCSGLYIVYRERKKGVEPPVAEFEQSL